MYIEHAYQQTQQVWPVEYEDQPTLLTSLESAEQYTHEHGEPSSTPPPKALRSFVRAQGLVFRF